MTTTVPPIEEQLRRAGATIADLRFPSAWTRRNKWGNQRVQTEDGPFDSQLERRVWDELKLRQAAGEIEDLKRQVGFAIFVDNIWICDYLADFTFYEEGKLVVADAKGKPTKDYLLKYRLMRAVFGITIREYTADGISEERKLKVKKKEVA